MAYSGKGLATALLLLASLLSQSSVAQPKPSALPRDDVIARVGSVSLNYSDASVGSQPWATLLCRFADSNREPFPKPFIEGLMAKTDDYWREASYDQMNLAGSIVSDWRSLPSPRSFYFPEGSTFGSGKWLDLAQDCVSSHDGVVDFTSITGLNIVMNEEPVNDSSGRGGGASVVAEGRRITVGVAWLGPNIVISRSYTVAHEMGHAFGLFHSLGPPITGDHPAAGASPVSFWDVMGAGGGRCGTPDPVYGCFGVHPILYHKYKLGWLGGGRLFSAVGGSETLVIHPLDTLPTSGVVGAYIPISDSAAYTVEVRRDVGYDSNFQWRNWESGEDVSDALLIHRIHPLGRYDDVATVMDLTTDNANPHDEGARWEPGEIFSDNENAVSVEVLSGPDSVGAYEVRITGGVAPDYVALGDSYSSGEGVEPFDNSHRGDFTSSDESAKGDTFCHRSKLAYGRLAGADLGFDTKLFACSGAKVKHLYSKQKSGLFHLYSGVSAPAQLDQLDGDTDVVSITMGGNDLGFADLILDCKFGDDGFFDNRGCNTYKKYRDIDQQIRSLKADLVAAYRAILRPDNAGNAKLFVMGYPQIFPSYDAVRSCERNHFKGSERDWLREKTIRFNSMIAGAVKTTREKLSDPSRIEFVNVLRAFDGHEVCTGNDAYVTGTKLKHKEFSFHPNQKGQTKLAELLAEAMSRDL